MAGYWGLAKPSLGHTTLRGETLDDMNRGRLRGWVLIGMAFLAILALLAWPDIAAVLACAAAATALALTAVWVHLSLPDTETEMESNAEAADTRDLSTGDND